MFETLYFIGFCLLAVFLIYWALMHDDRDEFIGREVDKKFRLPQKNENND